MDPEVESSHPPAEAPPSRTEPAAVTSESVLTEAPPPEPPFLKRVFIGQQGLRAGWSVLLFLAILTAVSVALVTLFGALHLIPTKQRDLTASGQFFAEFAGFLGMVGAAWIVALIERRQSILDYNLRGPGRLSRFAVGLVVGFASLSLLVGALDLGGWLHFGPVALSGTQILSYATVWGGVFLLVGFFEEGLVRCFLLFTLTRGINFWWASGLVSIMCVDLLIRAKGEGAWGIYGLAILGLLPCLALFLRKTPGAGFWYATWVTSTFFAFGHTGNNGETWVGIFAAGAVGIVFCVSVKVTGSAWWAIGCHAAWDWAETYFYGTADSGMVAKGHYLNTSPAGEAFWSGGSDGPEGSVLVLGVLLLMLAAVLLLYRRRRPPEIPAIALQGNAN